MHDCWRVEAGIREENMGSGQVLPSQVSSQSWQGRKIWEECGWSIGEIYGREIYMEGEYGLLGMAYPLKFPLKVGRIPFQSFMKIPSLLPIWNMFHLLIHFHLGLILSER